MKFSYYMPTRILFGEGSLNRLAREQLPGKKALIVTGGTSTAKLGYIDRLRKLLQKNKAHPESVVYDKVAPNPTMGHVEECTALARTEDCDFIIALGGGSCIDTAKAVALLLTNGGDIWNYANGGTGGSQPVQTPSMPFIAIPTTAGTGSEADPWMVITKETTNEKIGFGNNKTFPVLAVVDSELMQSVPSRTAAFQGFDALFHAVEGYLSLAANFMSDMYALKSMALIAGNLPAAVSGEKNAEAVANVTLASTLSGIVESTSSCVSQHAMEHTLSAFHPELPHGAGLIMLSRAYFARFLEACPERFADMAEAMGAASPAKPEDFITLLTELQVRCGVSNLRMSDYGIQKEALTACAENAMETGVTLFACDRAELKREDVVAIYEQAWR